MRLFIVYNSKSIKHGVGFNHARNKEKLRIGFPFDGFSKDKLGTNDISKQKISLHPKAMTQKIHNEMAHFGGYKTLTHKIWCGFTCSIFLHPFNFGSLGARREIAIKLQ